MWYNRAWIYYYYYYYYRILKPMDRYSIIMNFFYLFFFEKPDHQCLGFIHKKEMKTSVDIKTS